MIVERSAAIIAILLGLLLAGCSSDQEDTSASAPANPLVYEIASADGTVEGWMIGTIHALPADTPWRTPAIGRVVDASDLLVVEIAGLGAEADSAAIYKTLAQSPAQPPLAERIEPGLRAQLAALMARGQLAEADFSDTETWAAAIALARIDATGDPANGVDRALIADFAGRPVRELEGLRGQLAIFDRLPEAAQRKMLAAVVRESETARTDPERLQRAWLAGDATTLAASTQEGFLADPELREALLTGRNRRWIAAIVPLLAQDPHPLIAVGTAHLVGPEGLAALLEAEGYRVRRIS
ncbi:TraB/GumN family protein [Erythrobacter sp. BLCC-B19]|uniref:TraB/GumN family protein n=1 Tax=Erythrobacter sp. BLCC-B19 TaxID=3025315 RepID=UPI00235E68D3|nr:TraB/GumN family protein [Erythrobacter sp. BLCC-B19]WDA40611.1 TraB/GumN family protein [Erythrobacter sp. BLCC-B19]